MDAVDLAPPRFVHRDLRIVAKRSRVLAALAHRAYADHRPKPRHGCADVRRFDHLIINGLNLFVVIRHEQEKIVAAKMPGDVALLPFQFAKPLGDAPQNFVARFLPVPVVQQFEMLDIQRGDALMFCFRRL